MRMRNTLRDRRAIGCAQGDNRMVLQAANDLHQGEVDGAHLDRSAMQRAARHYVDIIAATLDVQSLAGNRECIRALRA